MLQFRGKIDSWIVVSEAINTILYQQDKVWRFWYDHLGGIEAIYTAFQFARQADPNAQIGLS